MKFMTSLAKIENSSLKNETVVNTLKEFYKTDNKHLTVNLIDILDHSTLNLSLFALLFDSFDDFDEQYNIFALELAKDALYKYDHMYLTQELLTFLKTLIDLFETEMLYETYVEKSIPYFQKLEEILVHNVGGLIQKQLLSIFQAFYPGRKPSYRLFFVISEIEKLHSLQNTLNVYLQDCRRENIIDNNLNLKLKIRNFLMNV